MRDRNRWGVVGVIALAMSLWSSSSIRSGAVLAQSADVEGSVRLPVATAEFNLIDLAARAAVSPAPPARRGTVPFHSLESGRVRPVAPPLPREAMAPLEIVEPEGPNMPYVPSPAPSLNFQALDDGGVEVPPDTHSAIGSGHVMTTLNDRLRVHTKDGSAVLTTITLAAFVAPVNGAGDKPFDPRVFYDSVNRRWYFQCLVASNLPSSGVILAVSQTGDPTGLWWIARWDADGTDQYWADFGSTGFSSMFVVTQVNMNVNNSGVPPTFFRPDIYVWKISDLLAGTLMPTVFTGASSGTTGLVGSTLSPSVTRDPGVSDVFLVQTWNNNPGQLRVSRISNNGGNPQFTGGLSFVQGATTWGTPEPFIVSGSFPSLHGGSAPQQGTTAGSTSDQRIMNNDDRMLSVFLRNNVLWAAHTIFLNSAGNGDTGQGPINHSAAQWWRLDPTITNGGTVAPLAHGRIVDSTANNCHNGSNGTLAGCTQMGTFYAYPSIAANYDNDVVMGYSQFSPGTWASGAYVFRDRADAGTTFRDSNVFRPGLGLYDKGSVFFFVTSKRWGDYSATLVDPSNDCNFWTAQEYADMRSPGARWAVGVARVPVVTRCTDLIHEDSFESNNLFAWDVRQIDGGDLTTVPQSSIPCCAIDGTFAMSATLDDTNPVYVQDDSPANETFVRVHLRLLPNTVDPGMSQSHFRLRTIIALSTEPVQRRAFVLVLRRQGAQYALRLRATLDSGVRMDTPFVNIGASSVIDIEWTRATGASTNNGQAVLKVDGATHTLSNLDNFDYDIDSIRMGAMSVKTGAGGTMFFDKYGSARIRTFTP
jgi:hypothetical protein